MWFLFTPVLHTKVFASNWLLAHWWKMNDACCIDFCQTLERLFAHLGFDLTFPGLTDQVVDDWAIRLGVSERTRMNEEHLYVFKLFTKCFQLCYFIHIVSKLVTKCFQLCYFIYIPVVSKLLSKCFQLCSLIYIVSKLLSKCFSTLFNHLYSFQIVDYMFSTLLFHLYSFQIVD